MVTSRERMVITGGGISPLFLDTVLDISGVERPKLVIESSALSSQEKFVASQKIFDFFASNVKDCTLLQSHYGTEPSPEQAQEAIQAADILFVMGGSTRRAYSKWQEWGIADLANERVRNGDLVAAGGSAGALIWFSRGYSDSRSYEVPEGQRWNYIGVEGTGFIPSWATVHYTDTDGFGRKRNIGFRRFLGRHSGEWQTAVGIETAAAIVCYDGLVRSMDIRSPEKRTSPEQTIHIFNANDDYRGLEPGEAIPLSSFR